MGFIAYAGIAGLSAATEWGTFYVSLPHVGSIAAAFVGFFFGTLANFLLSRGLVFRSRRSATRDFVLVYAASAIAFVANFAIYVGLYWGLDVYVMVSKVVGTCFGFAFNYSARQFYIFSSASRFAALSKSLHAAKATSNRDM